jgi:transposase
LGAAAQRGRQHHDHVSLPRSSWLGAQKKTLRASEHDRPDVVATFKAFVKELASVPDDRLVSIDEAGCNLAMVRSHARAARGERAFGRRPASVRDHVSLIGAVRQDEVEALDACYGPVDTDRFVAFIERHLFHRLRPGDVVLLDNLRVHKSPRVRELIEKAGARIVFVPPYHPELNPIEEFWAFIKRILKGLAARTIPALVAGILSARRQVSCRALHGWFKHARQFHCDQPA